jgi:hypothetical protein
MALRIRENVALLVGIGLPLVVVAFFILASTLPRMLVEPPQHALLLTTTFNNRNLAFLRVEFDVIDERLRVRLFPIDTGERSLRGTLPVPRLFVWEPDTEATREITLPLPSDASAIHDVQEVVIPELADWRISTSRQAPDGYEYKTNFSGGGGLFNALFGGGRRPLIAVEKDGATITVDTPDEIFYGMDFLGWVVDRGGR